jgi:hypothetical protein
VARVRRPEVLRYLGHTDQTVDPELAARIEAAAARCEAELEPRFTWRAFDVARGRDGWEVAGTALVLAGSSMDAYLDGAEQVALLAVTLGAACDRTLRVLGARDPLDQLLFDAAATDLVEGGADAAEAEVAAWARERGLHARARFSPGYGDLDLAVQRPLLDVLDAGRRLGLTTSSSNLLVPTKSVTALVGLFSRAPRGGPLGCGFCGLAASCSLRERGLACSGAARAAAEAPDVC